MKASHDPRSLQMEWVAAWHAAEIHDAARAGNVAQITEFIENNKDVVATLDDMGLNALHGPPSMAARK